MSKQDKIEELEGIVDAHCKLITNSIDRICDPEDTITEQNNLIGDLQVQVEEHDEELTIMDARLSEIEEMLDKVRWAFNSAEDECEVCGAEM